MIHALLFSLIAVFLAFLSRYKSYKYGLEVAFIILAIFMGVRYNWGNDYVSYLNMFYGNTYLNDFSQNYIVEILADDNSEFGWKLLNMSFKKLGFFTMVFVLTCFEYYILYKAIKKYVSPRWYWLAVFLFTFNSGFMLTGCSMMRQFLAMTIVIISLEYLINGKLIKYICCIFFAATFHTSALVMIPFYCVRKLPVLSSHKALLGVAIGSYIYIRIASLFVAALLPILLSIGNFERYEEYMEVKGIGGFGLGVIYYLLIFLLSLKSGKYLDSNRYVLAVLSSLYIIFIPFTTIAPLVARVGYYFSYLSVLTLPVIFEKTSRTWWGSILLIVTFIFTIYLWYSFFYSEVWHDSMYKYNHIFNAPMWM